MTNAEAIETLRANYPDACFEQLRCAVDMAINALTKEAWKEEHPVSPLLQKLAMNLQPCKQDADDTISRAAAIAIAKDLLIHLEEYHQYNQAINNYCAEIIKLPSAEPETHDKRTETHACDCISRQAAIDAHYEYCNKHPDAGFPVWSLKILEDLPSAQSERKKGEWIDYTEDGYVECPFCHSATNCDGNKDELHFCFSCGADMREPEDIPMEYFESGGR